jgi:diadenosine tetraphosphatase ApaH/serine/threonine PP2A family protein phosphatase
MISLQKWDSGVVSKGRAKINPGSVGLPWDGNRKASYCILSEDEPRVPYFHRVEYDVNSVIEKLDSRHVPLNYDTKRRLQEALI